LCVFTGERPWAKEIGGGTDAADPTVETPTSIFLNNLLPYRFMNEALYIVQPSRANASDEGGSMAAAAAAADWRSEYTSNPHLLVIDVYHLMDCL